MKVEHTQRQSVNPVSWIPSPPPLTFGCRREYHSKTCLSSVCWSPLYMENTVQSSKVVETNNFLMYIMHDVRACGHLTLCVCACVRACVNKCLWVCVRAHMCECLPVFIWMYTPLSLLAIWKAFSAFTFFLFVSNEKVHKRLRSPVVCSFLNGLQWMRATHILTK